MKIQQHVLIKDILPIVIYQLLTYLLTYYELQSEVWELKRSALLCFVPNVTGRQRRPPILRNNM